MAGQEKNNSEITPGMVNRKKSLIMTLGNAKDIDALLEMLENTTEQEILTQLIVVLGALGKKRAIAPLQRLIGRENLSHQVRQRAIEAIEVISSLSNYR